MNAHHWGAVNSIYQAGLPCDGVDDKNYLKHQTFNFMPPGDPSPSPSHITPTVRRKEMATHLSFVS